MNDPHNDPGPTPREREQLFTHRHLAVLLIMFAMALVALGVWAFR